MALPIEDTRLREAALAYVMALYAELAAQNAAPTLGTQNQAIDFILADPELRRELAEWQSRSPSSEAGIAPPPAPPHDVLFRRVREYLLQTMETPVLMAPAERRPH